MDDRGLPYGYWTREAVEERKFIRALVKGTLVEKL